MFTTSRFALSCLPLLLVLSGCEYDDVIPDKDAAPITKCISHRGKVQAGVENSMAGLEDAYAQGADGSEFDIQQTKDGVAFLNHDPILKKTGTSKPGKVCPLEEPVEKLEWKFIQENCMLTSGEDFPSFENVLKTFKDRDFILLFDFKINPSDKSIALIKKYYEGKYDQLISAASFATNLQSFYSLNRKMPNDLYVSGDMCDPAQKNGFDGVEMRKTSEAQIKIFKAENMKISLFDINDAESMRKFMDLGVNYITTDELATCLEVKAQKFHDSQGL